MIEPDDELPSDESEAWLGVALVLAALLVSVVALIVAIVALVLNT